MEWALLPLKRYAQFEGRSRRKEYWSFYLLVFAVLVVAGAIDAFATMGLLQALVCLAVFVPLIAVGIRRLHDTGRSGWWLLLGFLPILGAIILIVFLVQESQAGDNRYGPDPLADEATVAALEG